MATLIKRDRDGQVSDDGEEEEEGIVISLDCLYSGSFLLDCVSGKGIIRLAWPLFLTEILDPNWPAAVEVRSVQQNLADRDDVLACGRGQNENKGEESRRLFARAGVGARTAGNERSHSSIEADHVSARPGRLIQSLTSTCMHDANTITSRPHPSPPLQTAHPGPPSPRQPPPSATSSPSASPTPRHGNARAQAPSQPSPE